MNLQLVLHHHHHLDRMHAEQLDLYKCGQGKKKKEKKMDGMSIQLEKLWKNEVAVKFKRNTRYFAGVALDLSLSFLLLLGLSLPLNETLYVLWEVFSVEILCTQR